MTDRPKFRTYGETPLDELRQTISFAIWHATDREMGSQQWSPCPHDSCDTQPALDIEQWKREQGDPEHKKRRHLVALRLAFEVGQGLSGWAYNAHETGGASWAEIGEVLGVSRQAAWERFGGKFGQPTQGDVK